MAAVASPILKDAFSKATDIGDIVQDFDFSKVLQVGMSLVWAMTNHGLQMSVNDTKSADYLQTKLAPSYGNLSGSVLEKMDDDLKIMIAGTMKSLAAQKDKSWAAVLSTMMQNPLLEADRDEVARSDKLIKESSSAFKFDGSSDAGIVKEVHSWFVNLISDSDVLESTQIKIGDLADIVSQTGATVDSFESFFGKNEHHERTLIDIGVLRFPDIDRPFFKVEH
ncbi:uncharacterized protein CCOS01_00309 [Colletotrichum costaricense]|uniref:Uncharacterized protein n=1 Tax=Colletotrichum costaricense TaxID=1209916 RepID=A0AAJ0E601_9PEZI|nr:uncharacterized protein CCOS01_00309 [Colletotrichum costaricense]KAK1538995.1 hypothetical protein CCOS01_00309 [Colletotrichum costaricense]